MKQRQFEQTFGSLWSTYEGRLEQLRKRRLRGAALREFFSQYRTLCQHVALAEQRHYSPYLIMRLQTLAQRGHQIIHAQQGGGIQRLLDFVRDDFPCCVRRHWRSLTLCALLLYGSALLFGLFCYYQPYLIYSLMSPEDVRQFSTMYEPANSAMKARGVLGSDDWKMFNFYINNNVGIAFRVFAWGPALGIGTLLSLMTNGLHIGGVAGFLTQLSHHGESFWPFVVGHSALELNAIVIAAAAGLQLGLALLSPGVLSRLDALRIRGREGITLIAGAALMLLIAAFIEGYWSALQSIQPITKYLVGLGLWCGVGLYLLKSGRNAHADR